MFALCCLVKYAVTRLNRKCKGGTTLIIFKPIEIEIVCKKNIDEGDKTILNDKNYY